MKILESYLGIAESLFIEAEIDDEEMIKYKDKDGESKEMKAGSAKTMDKEHPAKIEYDRMADKGGEEEPKGKGLGKGDFERDFDDGEPEDKPFGGDTGKDADSETGKDYTSKFQGTDEPEGGEPEDAEKRMAQIDKERESLSRQYNRLDQPGADKSGEGKAKVMKKWDALDAEYDELEKSVGDEPEGEPPEDMSDEELGDAAQQASDEYDIARRKADDVAMRTGNTDSDEHKAAEAAYTKVTDLENEMKKRKASAQAVSALGSDGSDEQAENLYQLVKTPEDRDDPVLGKEHEVESDDGDYTYDSPGWEIVQNIAVKARNSDDPAETFKKEFENAPPEVQEYILANIGKGKAESIKVINGKKYRPIKESVEPKKHLLREMYERIGGK